MGQLMEINCASMAYDILGKASELFQKAYELGRGPSGIPPIMQLDLVFLPPIVQPINPGDDLCRDRKF
jgi:hypothetical protein